MYSLKLHSIVSRRFISTQQSLYRNHYDSLGLTPKATQSDIKTAYYKLSMLYHPDKNKGSDVAADKFRDISSAYEILGNYKLRRLYDKGIIHTTGVRYNSNNIDIEEEDPQTKFYKAHMSKSKAPPASGRTPIYDFDAWSQEHYGAAFKRQKEARARYELKMEKSRTDSINIQKEYIIFALTLLTALLMIGFYREAEMGYDSAKHKKKQDKKS